MGLLSTLSAASKLHSSRLPFTLAQTFPSRCRRHRLVQGASARRRHSYRSRGAQVCAKLSLSRKLILSSAVLAGAFALWATRLSDLPADHRAAVVGGKFAEGLGYEMLCAMNPPASMMRARMVGVQGWQESCKPPCKLFSRARLETSIPGVLSPTSTTSYKESCLQL